MRRVLAVAINFPTPRFPERGAFVMNALLEMSKRGVAVDVVAPVSWLSELKYLRNAPARLDFGPLRVTQPRMTAIPLRFRGREAAITAFNDRRLASAVRHGIPRDAVYDFAYAHFLAAGRAALEAHGGSIPVFLNLGESDPWDYDKLYPPHKWVAELSRFAGIVVVSRRSHGYLLARDAALAKKMVHIPNGVDTTFFRPLEQADCRRQLGLPANERIVLFCGHFDERKGPLRVLAAARQLGIKAVFLGGNGPDRPAGPHVLFAGSVPNSQMPTWYGAADVFALPSLSEGMSNAMLEALACGVPMVVGDLEFNTAFLDPRGARFVDPRDARSIAHGIEACLDPQVAGAMRAANLERAQAYSLKARIEKILDFVDARLR